MSLAMESPVETAPPQFALVAHPLEPLSPPEIERAVALIKAAPKCPQGVRFACVQLHEPDKATAMNPAGDPWNRQAFAILLAPEQTLEVVVSLSHNTIESWQFLPGAHPPLLLDESFECEATVKAYAPSVEACAKRGVFDMDLVMVDPWSAGAYGDEEGSGTEGRRLARDGVDSHKPQRQRICAAPRPAELYASGAYPNQHAGGAGFPQYIEHDAPTENTDVVVCIRSARTMSFEAKIGPSCPPLTSASCSNRLDFQSQSFDFPRARRGESFPASARGRFGFRRFERVRVAEIVLFLNHFHRRDAKTQRELPELFKEESRANPLIVLLCVFAPLR